MHFDLQPTLENDLVLLRPLEKDDFESLYSVASDPLLWEQHPNNDRYKEDVFKALFEDAIQSKGAFIIIDKKNNAVIGSTRFKRLATTDDAVEIGWTFLSRSVWGGHYNQSIKHLMIDYAFKSISQVLFNIGENNMRSRKAVEKIGGVKISGAEYKHLVSEKPGTVTYLIKKNN